MGIMLVYDITNAKSFDNIATWIRNIEEVFWSSLSFLKLLKYFFKIKHANEDVVKMIVGNKCDMEDRRIISVEKGQDVI